MPCLSSSMFPLFARAVLILAAGVAGTLSIDAHAATRAVTQCNDAGAGSLRATVATAASGDTVDLRGLACDSIVLTGGAITVAQDDLTLLGPGRHALAIDGNRQDRILRHTGMGTLRITGVTIRNGVNVQNFASGGCVWSGARVSLRSSIVRDCRVEGIRNPDDDCETCPMGATGGAIRAREVRLEDTTIAHSRADVPFDSQGGGIAVTDRLVMYGSRLTGNVATNGTGAYVGRELIAYESLFDHNGFDVEQSVAEQGAVYVVDGQAVLVRSAVVDNIAMGCAGVCVQGRAAIVDSTVARNQGNAILRFSEEGLVANSTVAANRWSTAPVTNPILCLGAIITPRLMLESSIVALNTCGSDYALDIGSFSPTLSTVVGANNLVQYSRVRLPADTLRVHPRLQPLANNGGTTPTMMPVSGSPVIDRGHNALGLAYDQRGPGFPRVRGVRADIGAHER